MRPFSPFLNDLNHDIEQLQQVAFTSIWTPFDLMIVPAWSSVTPPAEAQIVPVLLHKWMVYDDRVFAKVVAALTAQTSD
jgi:triacylglycerol lipase